MQGLETKRPDSSLGALGMAMVAVGAGYVAAIAKTLRWPGSENDLAWGMTVKRALPDVALDRLLFRTARG